jgi:hypothetical protein
MLSSPAYPGIPAGKLLVRNGATLLLSAPSLSGDITLPASITALEAGCLAGTGVTGITVPDGITVINKGAFASSERLSAVTLPSSVSTIGEFAFAECPLLTSVNIPPAAVVGFRAFRNSGITAVTVPAGARLANEVFSECYRLQEANIQTVQIGDGTFINCTALEQVTLSPSLMEIPRSTFAGCTALSTVNSDTSGTVVLPAPLEGLLDKAFFNCRSITTVDMSGLSGLVAINPNVFSGCTALVNVTLPSGLTQINTGAFNDCSSLAAINIPAPVTRLGDKVFRNCSMLQQVTVRAAVPPTITMIPSVNGVLYNTFYANHVPLTFHVPADSLAAYQTAWAALGANFTAIE